MTWLDLAKERVRQLLHESVTRGEVPGAVALIAQRDEHCVISAGHRALGDSTPLQRDAIFRIASMTKPITALAALLLVDDGKLRLDESVDRLLPELAQRRVLRHIDGPLDDTVPANRAITVEDLLTLRLGFGLPPSFPAKTPIVEALEALNLHVFGPPRIESYTADEWIRRLGQLPLMAQPGERWLYNTGSAVLGVLIARACGRSLPSFLQERVFEPLGMRDTAFHVPQDKLARLPAVYQPQGENLQLVEPAQASERSQPPIFPGADAGLLSTIDDCFAFARLLLGHGRYGQQRLLSDSWIETMTRDHLTGQQHEHIVLPHLGWGYGLAVLRGRSPEGVPAGAYGWNGGRGTSLWIDPHAHLTVILMTQRKFTSPDPPAIHKRLWCATFGEAQA